MVILLLLLVAVLAPSVTAAPPPAPAMLAHNGAPTNGFWLTNVTFVWTNTAIRTPTIDLSAVTVYGTNALRGAVVLSWVPAPNSDNTVGYRIYYGKVGGSVTNRFEAPKYATSAAFYSSLTTNVAWWAYATAYSASEESVPTTAVVFTP